MIGFPSRETVESLRKEYPPGTMVILEEMRDAFAPPPGNIGEVTGVDDVGSVEVHWQNGSHLSAIFGVDRIRKI